MAEATQEKDTSIKICYELSVKSIEQLVSMQDALDAKTLPLLGVASALITFVPALAKAWLEQPVNVKNIPFLFALVLFGFAAFFLLRAYWPKAMISTYDPEVLLEDYASLEPEECRLQLLKYLATNYKHNYSVLLQAGGDVKWGFRLVIAETGFLIMRLLLG